MPTVQISNLPSTLTPAHFAELEDIIKETVAGIPGLNITENFVVPVLLPMAYTPTFPRPIPVLIPDFYKRSDRTPAVKRCLGWSLVRAITDFLMEKEELDFEPNVGVTIIEVDDNDDLGNVAANY